MSSSPAVVRTTEELRASVRQARGEGLSVGLVPTMGALHDGHTELVRVARREAGFVVVSIFVNPTQFGPNEDYKRYPRTEAADVAVCGAAGADLIYAPRVEEMYPNGQESTFVEVREITGTLEGKSRPTHFRGVTTVVAKLFLAAQPDAAWFGEKDYQQLQVIRRMVADLLMPVRVVAVPTVREPDGLALSSRNQFLSAEERTAATVLWRAIETARAAVAGGETSAQVIREVLKSTVESERLARLDYAEVADAETLAPVVEHLGPDREARVLLAVRFGETRLIDNAPLT